MYGTREIELDPPAAVPLLELDALKAALSLTGDDSDDDELNALIIEVSTSIETYCGTIFGERTVTERHFLEESGHTFLLRYTPAIELTEVESDGTSQTIGDYRLNTMASTLRRKDHAPFGTGEHVITYTAGYAEDEIPPAVSRAALELAKYLHDEKMNDGDVYQEQVVDVGQTTYANVKERTVTANGASLPVRIASILAPYKKLFIV